MTQIPREIEDERIRFQILADDYAKAKLSHAPSAEMRAVIDRFQALLHQVEKDQLIFVSKMLGLNTVTEEHLKKMVDNRLKALEGSDEL